MKYRFKKEQIGIFKENESSQAASLLKKGEVGFGFTDGKFSLIDLLFSCLKITGKAEITLCTWSAGIKDIHQIRYLLDTNYIENIRIITDKSFVGRQANYALALTELFGEENIRISSIHAKFILISNNEWNVCIFSSMNLNANNNIENFVIAEGEELYSFVDAFVEKHFEDGKTGLKVPFKVVQERLRRVFGELRDNKSEWWEQ